MGFTLPTNMMHHPRRSNNKNKSMSSSIKTTGTVDTVDDTLSVASTTASTSVSSYAQHQNNGQSLEPKHFLFHFVLGFSKTPDQVVPDPQERSRAEGQYWGAIATAMGHGGVYTDRQVEWLKGYMMTAGVVPDLVERVEDNFATGACLEDVELVTESSYFQEGFEVLKLAGRSMVYEMYKCASLAQYPAEQLLAIELVAEELGVTGYGTLDEIKAQVDEEQALQQKRLQLLFPQGHPLI